MTKYLCRKCKKGVLKPIVVDEHETELSELFICSHCHHKAKIPAAMIVFSQIVSSLAGGLVTAYLFIEQLSILVTSIQFGIDANLTKNVSLLIISLLFLLGFGYTLFIGFQGFSRRQIYLNSDLQVEDHPQSPNSSSNTG
ncbi:hypothetical protein BTA51_08760 [Hahella sp. CCB-MM4]|uniref:hypothetical protein n=1 Tax=Hahella sp. (strain CCB-MM4) TaxID=1926491 RepID=UPI000B9A694F|nr:hypothetical protein [Hahella sp. CCB-MM4]OZG73868.1 hypothetical protein BTA51_08760 [Hahella sp. CCB-MM4]